MAVKWKRRRENIFHQHPLSVMFDQDEALVVFFFSQINNSLGSSLIMIIWCLSLLIGRTFVKFSKLSLTFSILNALETLTKHFLKYLYHLIPSDCLLLQFFFIYFSESFLTGDSIPNHLLNRPFTALSMSSMWLAILFNTVFLTEPAVAVLMMICSKEFLEDKIIGAR